MNGIGGGKGRTGMLGLAALAGLLIAGCSGERDFDAETLVADLNEAGAGLELGEPLSTTEGIELTALRFSGPNPGSGAVAILDDPDAARQEFARCESAVTFVCFRAANAVLRFEDLGPTEQAQVTVALTEIETDEGS